MQSCRNGQVWLVGGKKGGVGTLGICMTCRCDAARWRYRREAYISALLIAMAVQSAAAFTPCVAVRLPPSKLSDPIWFARLIYAEAMAVMPIMFVVSACLSFVSAHTMLTTSPVSSVRGWKWEVPVHAWQTKSL